jgi:ribosomal protein S27AE
MKNSARDNADAAFARGDIDGAIPHLKEAANSGDWEATYNLAMVYANHPSTHYSDFISTFKGLAERKDPIAMIVLGTVYCGYPKNIYRERYIELNDVNLVREGLPMMEAGIATLEQNPDKCEVDDMLYREIANAYHNIVDLYKKQLKMPDSERVPNIVKGLEKKVRYLQKALVGMKKAGYPTEAFAVIERMISSAKDELAGFSKSPYVSKPKTSSYSNATASSSSYSSGSSNKRCPDCGNGSFRREANVIDSLFSGVATNPSDDFIYCTKCGYTTTVGKGGHLL